MPSPPPMSMKPKLDEILATRRPNGADDADPEIAAALERARAHAETREQLEAEEAFDQAIADALGKVEPPESLRAALMAGAGETVTDEGGATRQKAWWRHPVFLSVAAVLVAVVIVGISLAPATAEAEITDFYAHVTDHFEKTHRETAVEFSEDDHGAVQDWLEAQNSPVPDKLPAEVLAFEIVGAYSISWRDEEVSVLSLRKNGDPHHLYIIEHHVFDPDDVPDERNQLRHDGFSLEAWKGDDHLHVMVMVSR